MEIAALHAAKPTPSLAAALAQTQQCLEELRAVARLASPPVLESAGLAPAVVALTEGRLAKLDIPSHRWDAAAERTAYLIAAESHRRASAPIPVTGRARDDQLNLTITGPPPRTDSIIHDRVAALGGTITSNGERTEVTLPCA